MKTKWHYADNGVSIGPISYADVAYRIEQDKSGNHFVWQEGMSEWADAKTLPTFVDLFRSVPPSPPVSEYNADLSRPSVQPAVVTITPPSNFAAAVHDAATSKDLHPWRRYFARMLDNYVFVLCAGFAAGLLFPDMFSSPNGSHADNGQWQLQGILYLALYVPVEAFCLYAFGTTFGKALYGIRLAPKGTEVTFYDAAHRSALVWFRGIGIGIPIIGIFTLINANSKLKANGATTWDKELGWSVKHSKIGVWRWIGILICWAGISFVVAALTEIGSR